MTTQELTRLGYYVDGKAKQTSAANYFEIHYKSIRFFGGGRVR